MATKSTNGNGNGAFSVVMKLSKLTAKGNHAIYAPADEAEERITSLYIQKTGWGGKEPLPSIEVTVKGMAVAG